jgi:hypothetical protein
METVYICSSGITLIRLPTKEIGMIQEKREQITEKESERRNRKR